MRRFVLSTFVALMGLILFAAGTAKADVWYSGQKSSDFRISARPVRGIRIEYGHSTYSERSGYIPDQRYTSNYPNSGDNCYRNPGNGTGGWVDNPHRDGPSYGTVYGSPYSGPDYRRNDPNIVRGSDITGEDKQLRYFHFNTDNDPHSCPSHRGNWCNCPVR